MRLTCACVCRRRATRRARGPAATSCATSRSASPRRGCRAAACSDGAGAAPSPDPHAPHIASYIRKYCNPVRPYVRSTTISSTSVRTPPVPRVGQPVAHLLYFSIILTLVRHLLRGSDLLFVFLYPRLRYLLRRLVGMKQYFFVNYLVHLFTSKSDDLFLY